MLIEEENGQIVSSDNSCTERVCNRLASLSLLTVRVMAWSIVSYIKSLITWLFVALKMYCMMQDPRHPYITSTDIMIKVYRVISHCYNCKH